MVSYVTQTKARIDELTKEAEEAYARDDLKSTQRIKNMISAYESRLNKRAKLEDFKSKMNLRTQ